MKKLNILIAVLLTISAVFGVKLMLLLWDYKQSDDEYQYIVQAYTTQSADADTEQAADTTETGEEENTTEDTTEKQTTDPGVPFPDIQIDSEELKQQNSDYVAWLYMDTPEISYPVVQNPSPDFYLHTTFNGESRYAGCIYIDPDASPKFDDLVTFVYGHNMHNGSMFGKLKTIYNDPDSFTSPYFYLDVMGEHKTYKVFAVCKVDKSSSLYRIPTDDEYDKYVEEVFTASSTYQDQTCKGLKEHNSIVALSTCYGMQGTPARLLIFGVEER